MKIIKVFNQNAVLVSDNGQDKIVTGKGIGFSKKQNDIVPRNQIEREYVATETKSKMEQLLQSIDPEYFIASEEIIDKAEEMLNTKFNEHIHSILADHIAFAIDRIRDGIIIQNKLLNEIQILYPDEFRAAEWAVNYLREKFALDFTIDEAAYIAIHFHSASSGQSTTNKSIREVTIISAMVTTIAEELDVDFTKMSMGLNYSRLVVHLRYVVERVYQSKFHSMDDDVFQLVKTKYQRSYTVAEKVARMTKVDYGLTIPGEELGYITLHIERLSDQLGRNLD
ncbi:PRD domain-containing protein [uncultured Vagococcus sp.]|uniref:PRD domain-containing protein n=1 Tax=uncultured Vagococcus sp. TaxID=189676 RepID=UPI0028D0F2C5|nr:PRD domain-containing protein [uncultured Vagococcus sp.]